MHKVFISHHHDNDQWYKEELVKFGEQYSIFVDRSEAAFRYRKDCPYDLRRSMRRANS